MVFLRNIYENWPRLCEKVNWKLDFNAKVKKNENLVKQMLLTKLSVQLREL